MRALGVADARLVAEGESVHVAVGGADWRPRPLPEAFRAQVRAFEGARLDDAVPTGCEPDETCPGASTTRPL